MLSVYLSRLRRLLTDENGEQLLLTMPAGYVLRIPPGSLDVRAFEALLERGRNELATGEAEQASATLGDSLALWRGRPFADVVVESFAQTEIARLEELRLEALEARIEADLRLGRQDALVAELETLVAAHPFREGLRAQLMLALYRSGRQTEALETYRHARRTFSDELGIEPGSRLQELHGAILRHDPSLETPRLERPFVRGEGSSTLRATRVPPRGVLALAAGLAFLIAAALVAAAGESSGRVRAPVQLAGESVAVVDPGSDRIVGEIPVGGRPAGLAVGDGSVWVGNRDDDTLLRIDPRSLEVVRTIGLGAAPKDVEVGAGSVWILSDWAVLRVDPAINDVVDTIHLPPSGPLLSWCQMEVGANAVFVSNCGAPGSLLRLDPATRSIVSVRSRTALGRIVSDDGALWAIAGWESDTLERINAEGRTVETIPLARIGEASGWHFGIAVGEGAIWLLGPASLWRIDSTTKRFVGSVAMGQGAKGGSLSTGEGAVWIADFAGVLLRVDPDSQSVAARIPLGPLILPADAYDSVAVGEGSVWVATTSFAS